LVAIFLLRAGKKREKSSSKAGLLRGGKKGVDERKAKDTIVNSRKRRGSILLRLGVLGKWEGDFVPSQKGFFSRRHLGEEEGESSRPVAFASRERRTFRRLNR